MGDVTSLVTDGEHLTPETHDQGVPLLSAKDVRERGVEFENVKFVTQEDAEKFWKRCRPEPGDVLVVSRGATIGRVSRIQTDRAFCLMGSVILLKPAGRIVGGYLDALMRCPTTKAALIDLCGHSAQQAIYIRDIRKVPALLPPPPKQHEIVRRVEALFAVADAIEKRVAQASARADRLTQSILAKAFRGDLVPTEASLARTESRPYESAAELLARIHVERPIVNTTRRRRRGSSPRVP